MNNKTHKPLLIESIKAESDLIERRFVGFDGNLCATGKKALGVVDVSTSKDQFAPVVIAGIMLVEAGGDIAVGDEVTSDAEGKAILFTRADISNGFSLDSGAAGDLIRVVRGI